MASVIDQHTLEMALLGALGKAKASPNPYIFVFPSESVALKAMPVLNTLLSGSQLAPPILVPELKQSGVMRFESALRPIAHRMRAFHTLDELFPEPTPVLEKPIFLVCSLSSLLRVSPPRDWVSTNRRHLSLGQEIDVDDFLENLYSNFGYTRCNTVEQVGEFSQRGALVDVYSPAHAHPVRLEFLGDELASMRLFRTGDQRSFAETDAYPILPIREFSWPTEELMEPALHKFNQHLLRQKVQSKGRSDLLECLRAHTSFPGIHDLWPTFSAQDPTSLLNALKSYCPQWSLCLIGSLVAFEEAFKDLKNFYESAFEGAFGKHYASPRFDDVYPNAEATFTSLKLSSLADSPPLKGPLPILSPLEKAANSQKLSQRVQAILETEKNPHIKKITLMGQSPDSLLEVLEQWKNGNLPFPQSWPPTENGPSSVQPFQSLWIENKNADLLPPLCLGALETYLYVSSSQALIISEQWIRNHFKENAYGPLEGAPPPASTSSSQHAQFLLQNQFGDFTEGDAVVHVQYGVAKFAGLMTVTVQDSQADFLCLEYLGGDRIYVPVHKMNLVQKYVGVQRGDSIPLDSLKASTWEKRKARAKEEALGLAKELMAHQAKRNTTPGHAFSPLSEDYFVFESAFPYEETPDQLRSSREIMGDMGLPKPMDRLLCGDVGFGKTEVAMRAAYRSILDGKQVAWLVPTTVLAHQHFRSLQERFANFSVNIELFDRSSSATSGAKILEKLKNGGIDILVGTHKLLSKGVAFRDLGLLIVDEEQRFGVLQKEKIKNMSYGIDILTMTATPIPRTLQMAMLGLRDLSLLTTPPKARLAVKTFVCPFEPEIIEQAILEELKRSGQIFYVHNRVEELASVKEFLQGLVPHLRILVAHGKMVQKDLDKTIINFLEHQADLLLCSTIIESGIDMPNVNTILVQNADRFGLAQLYQLRGRVGRRSSRGYAYFLTSQDLDDGSDGAKRLQVLKDHQELGSGFIVASHDLEMRGAGNILGDDQSGKVLDVGLETYTQMLDDAVRDLSGLKIRARVEPDIHVPFLYHVTPTYIENSKERLRIYRRFFGTQSEEALQNLVSECVDRFGPLPPETLNLVEVARLRRWLVIIGAQSLSIGEQATEIRLPLKTLQSTQDQEGQLLFKRILDVCNRQAQGMRVTPDGRILLAVRKSFWTQKGISFLEPVKKALAALSGEGSI